MEINRTPDEWVTYFELVGTKHVFVEGVSDAILLRQALERTNCFAEIRIVADVNCEDLAFTQPTFCAGNKARLLAFADYLSQKKIEAARCLIDQDLEILASVIPSNQVIIMSDFSNFCACLFEKDHLDRVLMRAIGKSISAEVWAIVTEAIRLLTAVRAARYQLHPTALNIPADNMIAKGKILSTNEGTYLVKFLEKNGLILQKQTYIKALGHIRDMLPDDIRIFVNDHDFEEIFARVLKTAKIFPSSFVNAHIHAILMAGVDLDILCNQRCIIAIAEWLNI